MDKRGVLRGGEWSAHMDKSHGARHWIFAGGMLTLLAIVTRMATYGHPDLHVDEAFYFAAGVEVAQGAVPFVDVWDRKPPGHFMLFAALAMISNCFVTYQIAATLFAAATAIAIYNIARRLVSPWQASLGGVIYLLSICLFHGQGGQSPIFYNLFMATAAAALLAASPAFNSRRGQALVATAMLLAGIAITIKTTAVFEAIWFGIFAALLQVRSSGLAAVSLRRIIGWIGLGALPTLLFAAWYAASGYWDEYWTAMVLSNLRKPVEETERLDRLGILLMMLLPLLAATILAIIRITGSDRSFFAGWLVASFIGFVSVPAFYLHYALPLLVPLCALAPIALGLPRVGLFLLGTAAVTPALFYSFFDFGDTRAARTATSILVDAIQQSEGEGPVLVFDGPPLLYTLSGSNFPTALAFPNHLHQAAERNVSHIDTLSEVRRLLKLNPATIVDRKTSVTNTQTATLVRSYARENCRVLASEPMMKGWDIEVVVHGDCKAPAPK